MATSIISHQLILSGASALVMSSVTLLNSYWVNQQVAAEHQSTERDAAGESYINGHAHMSAAHALIQVCGCRQAATHREARMIN